MPSMQTWAEPATFRSRATVSVTPSTAPTRLSTRPVSQRRDADKFRRAFAIGEGKCLGHGNHASHVVGAAAPLTFLAATSDERGDIHTLPDGEDTNTFGPTELVGTERHEVDQGRDGSQVDPARGLHCVGVQQRLGGKTADEPRHERQVCDGANFVVHRHDAHQTHRVRNERSFELVEPDVAGGVDTDDDAVALFDRVQYRVVLGRRANSKRPATPAMTVLFDSLPQPVNTTSPGCTPSATATRSRASSSALRASRANRWLPLGFANRSLKNGNIASTALDRTGVVAA